MLLQTVLNSHPSSKTLISLSLHKYTCEGMRSTERFIVISVLCILVCILISSICIASPIGQMYHQVWRQVGLCRKPKRHSLAFRGHLALRALEEGVSTQIFQKRPPVVRAWKPTGGMWRAQRNSSDEWTSLAPCLSRRQSQH